MDQLPKLVGPAIGTEFTFRMEWDGVKEPDFYMENGYFKTLSILGGCSIQVADGEPAPPIALEMLQAVANKISEYVQSKQLTAA